VVPYLQEEARLSLDSLAIRVMHHSAAQATTDKYVYELRNFQRFATRHGLPTTEVTYRTFVLYYTHHVLYYTHHVLLDSVLCSTADKFLSAARSTAAICAAEAGLGGQQVEFRCLITADDLAGFAKVKGLQRFRAKTRSGGSPIRLATIGRMLDAIEAGLRPALGSHEFVERLTQKCVMLMAHQALLRRGKYCEGKLLRSDINFLTTDGYVVGAELLLRNAKTGSFTNGDSGNQTAMMYRRPDRFDPIAPLLELQQWLNSSADPAVPVFQVPHRGASAAQFRLLHGDDVVAFLRTWLIASGMPAEIAKTMGAQPPPRCGRGYAGERRVPASRDEARPMEELGHAADALLRAPARSGRGRSGDTDDAIAAVAARDLRSLRVLSGAPQKAWPLSIPEGTLVPGFPLGVPVAAVSAEAAMRYFHQPLHASATQEQVRAHMDDIATELPSAQGRATTTGPATAAGDQSTTPPTKPRSATIKLPAWTRSAENQALAESLGCSSLPPRYTVGRIVQLRSGTEAGYARVLEVLPYDEQYHCFFYSKQYVDGYGKALSLGGVQTLEVRPETDLSVDASVEAHVTAF